MKDIELWKDIPGYEGYYQASSYGRIRSCDRKVIQFGHKRNYSRVMRGKIISASKLNSGYLVVWLCKEGESKACTVHRLIAKSFIKNNKSYRDVNHKNGDKTDNHIENLEWCSHSHNMTHSYNHLQHKRRGKKVLCIDTGIVYDSINQAAQDVNLNKQAISHVLHGRNKTAGGYKWKELL